MFCKRKARVSLLAACFISLLSLVTSIMLPFTFSVCLCIISDHVELEIWLCLKRLQLWQMCCAHCKNIWGQCEIYWVGRQLSSCFWTSLLYTSCCCPFPMIYLDECGVFLRVLNLKCIWAIYIPNTILPSFVIACKSLPARTCRHPKGDLVVHLPPHMSLVHNEVVA